MKLTNLDYVQNILSSLGSDEVNSVSDTVESRQVLEILKTSYFNIIARAGLSEHDQLIQLDPSLDPDIPVMMYIPAGVSRLKWLKYFNSAVNSATDDDQHGINVDLVPNLNYSWSTTSTTSETIGTGTKIFTVASAGLEINAGDVVTVSYASDSSQYMTGSVTSYVNNVLTVSIITIHGSGTFSNWSISGGNLESPVTGYQYVTIVPIEQFIDMTNGFNPAETDTESFVFADTSNGFPGNFTFYYKTNKQPQYCTIISDYYVIFDGYDSTQDSTLQSSKTMAEGTVVPVWQNTDSFIPNIDENQVPLLLNEAKSLAFFELKQSPHPKAEQAAKRQWSSVQRDKSIIERPTYFDALPNFGRRGYANTSFFKSRGWDRP